MSKEEILDDSRLNRALDLAEVGYFEWRIGSSTYFLSQTFADLLDIDSPELTSADFTEQVRSRIHSADLPRAEDAIRALLAQPDDEPEEALDIRVRDRDGHWRWLDIGVNLRHTSPNEPPLLCVSFYDYTEVKEEEELARKEAEVGYRRYKRLINSMPAGVLVVLVKVPGKIEYSNDAMAAMLGAIASGNADRMKLRGTALADCVVEEDWPALAAALDPSGKAERNEPPFEVRLPRSIGPAIRATVTVRHDLWEEEEAAYIFVQDVSALRQTQIELEEKNKELEGFAYTVSHDLRTPLITMRAYLGLVEPYIKQSPSEDVRDDFQRVVRAASRLDQLLTGLLDYSRIGRKPGEVEKISLNKEVKRVVRSLGPMLSTAKVRVLISNQLPSIYGVRVRIVQLFQNLLENAVKFLGDQSDPVIEIGARRQQGRKVIFVRDNGIGIDPQHAERIFELFHKLDAHTQGNGIGLSLVRRIIESHGGKIWLEPSPITPHNPHGRGATFCFTLDDLKRNQE